MLITWLGMRTININKLAWAEVLIRAAWHGARIILRQVSDEATPIFDFILELYRVCDGNWASLASSTSVSLGSIDDFLDYAATFLGNIGNYYVSPGGWLCGTKHSFIPGARRSKVHTTYSR